MHKTIAQRNTHGLFDDDRFRHAFTARARGLAALNPAPEFADVTAQQNARIDRWAGHIKRHLDVGRLRRNVGFRPPILTSYLSVD